MKCNFFKHISKLIIFGTHNLHTFKHSTLINELLLTQFYLSDICPKLHPGSGRRRSARTDESVIFGMQFERR